MPQTQKPDTHMTGPQVLAWFNISDMTLWRWLRDPELAFPQPDLIVNRRRYWRADRITGWKPPVAAAMPKAA